MNQQLMSVYFADKTWFLLSKPARPQTSQIGTTVYKILRNTYCLHYTEGGETEGGRRGDDGGVVEE